MQVLILHAIGSSPRNHWQGWIADNLEAEGHSVVAPALPNPDHPDRSEWLSAAQNAAASLDPAQTIVIGHSLGVATGLDLIEQSSAPVAAFVSVAGFAYDYGAELNGYFMRDRDIDFTKVRANLGDAVVIYGDDDPYVDEKALAGLAESLNVEPTVVPSGGHLNTEAGYTEFPLLLETVKRLSKS